MILGWKNNASYSDEIIARNPGGKNYMTSYAQGLDPNDQYILRANGFGIEPPQCYTQNLISGLLYDFGPLWVATWAPGPHIRVIRGMSGSTLWINDPAPLNQGEQYKMSYSKFFGAMETLGARELNEPLPVYVAYLRPQG